MDLQKFIQDNIPEGEVNAEYNRYLYLKKRLEFQEKINSSEEGGKIFNEFLKLKDSLFTQAMNNWLNKRESK